MVFKIKTYILFFFFLFNIRNNIILSQTNILSNGGFETYSSCPTFMLQWNLCLGWDNCNGTMGGGLWGTPDYYNTCGTVSMPYNPVPPNTGMGYCDPHTGNAMMGLVCFNSSYSDYREYVSSKIDCELVPGNTYTISFWITASSAPSVKYNSNYFGVYLSNSQPVQIGYNYINVTPQFEIPTIINNTTWQKYSFTISPTSSLKYITLGCFKPETAISFYLETPAASQPYSNYFIDDVEILSTSGISTATINTTSSIINVSCNGLSNASATVTVLDPGTYNYFWSPTNYTTSEVSNLSVGNYTVNISDGLCSSKNITLTITEPPEINTIISQNIINSCNSFTSNLNLNVSGGTPDYNINWSNGVLNATSISVICNSSCIYSYTVTDANNCFTSQSIQINGYQTNSTFENIPNVFTPNNDGVNDFFDFKTIESCNLFTFEIYDRWGLKIFYSQNNKATKWDGKTLNGDVVPDGTYYYIMETNSSKKLKGNITIFR